MQRLSNIKTVSINKLHIPYEENKMSLAFGLPSIQYIHIVPSYGTIYFTSADVDIKVPQRFDIIVNTR